MSQIGIGIIGTGTIADACHAPAIQSVTGAYLAGVLSREQGTGRAFLDRHGAGTGRVHTELEAFAGDPSVQLAIICSPDRLHFRHARACLNAGKHVLLEKPVTTSLQDAEDLIQLAISKKLILAAGFHLRSHNGHLALRSKVQAGAIGALRHVRAIWAFPQKDDSNWRAKEELGKWWSLAAVGTHCLDLARWFADDMDDWRQFSSVISRSVWRGPHDESAVIAAELSSGVTIEVVSSVQFGTYHRVELFGEDGIATCQGTLGREGAGEIRVNDDVMSFSAASPFVNQLANVITCINMGGAPRADGAVGLRGVKDLLLASDV